MTHQEFKNKNNGKFVEVAGSANALNQCVDLGNAYLRDVLGHAIVEWTNAIGFPEKLLDFEWIENTPDAIPQQGDLMIFFGYYGHISIFDEGDINRFRSFDQNFPANSPCHIQEHNYNNVFGWLRSPEGSNMADCTAERESRDHYWNVLKEISITLEDEIQKEDDVDKLPAIVEDLMGDVIKLEDELENFKCPECPIISPSEPSDGLKLVSRTEESVKDRVKIIKKYAI